MAVITTDELKDHLGIDYADNMVERNLARAVNTADMYLCGALGEDYPEYDARVKEIALTIAADIYDNRTASEAASSNMRKLISDMCLQVKLEMRRLHADV